MDNIQTDISDNGDSPLDEISKPKKDDVFEVTKDVLCVTIIITVVYYFVDTFFFKRNLDETIVRLGSLEPLFIIASFLVLEACQLGLSKCKSLKNKLKENNMLGIIRRRIKEREEKRRLNRINEVMAVSERAINLPQDSELPQDTYKINQTENRNSKNNK